MTTFHPITLICTICRNSFESNEIASCGYANKRTDFRPNYWGFNPVEYFYHLCVNCGFCAPKNLFETKIESSDLKQKIEQIGNTPINSLSQKLERAMVCLEFLNDLGLTNKNEFELGNIWLDLYWWSENLEEIKKFGEKIINYYEIAFEKGQVPSDQFYTILYLIGEIYRRIGNQDQANKYFDEVISLTKNRKDQETVHNLAIQQKTNPKENL